MAVEAEQVEPGSVEDESSPEGTAPPAEGAAETAAEAGTGEDAGEGSAETEAASVPEEEGGQEESSVGPAGPKGESLDNILAVKLPLIVKLAAKQMTVGEFLSITLGGIIQFETDAYAHVELLVNNCPIGLGQPVKVGENFGLRVVQIGDIAETIKSLGLTGETAEA